MKNALWLYLCLLIKAKPRSGKTMESLEDLSQEMGIKEPLISSWLGLLRKHNYVSVRKQGNMKLIKIAKWRRVPEPEELLRKAKQGISRKSSKAPSQRKQLTKEQTELAQRIADTFNDGDDLDYYQGLCNKYSVEAMLSAFQQSLKTPSDRIKQSRRALFTFLLKKHAQDQKKQV
jgi:DNA-binding transcriptional ArsR family regulator